MMMMMMMMMMMCNIVALVDCSSIQDNSTRRIIHHCHLSFLTSSRYLPAKQQQKS